MPEADPQLEERLRAVGDDEGLEKAMAFAAVRRSLVGDALGVPDGLGKYKVLERIGAGGMGAVFAAWDPELERRVALKVLVGRSEAAEEQKLIMREAKAAAQLSHPNVVTVFEVGVAQGRVFLAMEYIRGKTLRRWLDDAPKLDAKLDVLLQAGRGLAAAHGSGLVHRDFKPDNVLVDDDGRAKVVDFGLAHSSAEVFEAACEKDGSPTDGTPAPLTQTGPWSGTPQYMAPEALRGAGTDARSDQFAFAVTAWELLCGERPFVDNATGGAPQGKPATGLPRRVVQALTRALADHPGDRFPTMATFLDALDPAPAAARRTRWVLVGATSLSIGALAWGLRPRDETASPLCTGAERRLDGLWDDTRRFQFEEAFTAADSQRGPAAWTRTRATLERYADAWVDASNEACAATRIRGEESDETLTLRTRCLHGRLRSFRGLTERFSTLDAGAVWRASAAAENLPRVQDCADPEFLAAQVEPPPSEDADAVEAAQERLAELDGGERLGQYKDVSTSLPALVDESTSLGYRPLLADVEYLRGHVAQRMGDLPAARAALERAVTHALASSHDHTLAKAMSLLGMVVGYDLSQKDAGLLWSDHATAAVERIGGDAELEALQVSRRGLIHLRAGDLDEARMNFEAAAKEFAEAHQDSVQIGDMLTNLANISISLGEWDRASDELAQALEYFEPFHGPEHPAVGAVLGNQGIVLRNLQRYDEARDAFRRAREIFNEAQGEEHPRVAAIDLNLGNVELEAGNHAEGLRLLDSAAKRLEAALGAEHEWVARALKARGDAYLTTNDLKTAQADLERAAEILQRTSPDSTELAATHCSLGQTWAKQDDIRAARAAYERGMERYRAALGEEAATHAETESCRNGLSAVSSAG